MFTFRLEKIVSLISLLAIKIIPMKKNKINKIIPMKIRWAK